MTQRRNGRREGGGTEGESERRRGVRGREGEVGERD